MCQRHYKVNLWLVVTPVLQKFYSDTKNFDSFLEKNVSCIVMFCLCDSSLTARSVRCLPARALPFMILCPLIRANTVAISEPAQSWLLLSSHASENVKGKRYCFYFYGDHQKEEKQAMVVKVN